MGSLTCEEWSRHRSEPQVHMPGTPGASAQGSPPGPLPAHKFGPHDIVRLRASKAAAGAPVLTEGVVYRLRDDSIIIAGDGMIVCGGRARAVDLLATRCTHRPIGSGVLCCPIPRSLCMS